MFDADTVGDREVVELFRDLEVERRRREVELALLVGEVDQRNLYEPDGMRTVESWCRGTARWTNSEARHARRVAQLLRNHSDVISVDAAIALPVGHLREIARAAANPRCGSQIPAVMPALLHWGDTLDYAAFATVVRRFETLADVDGTHEEHEESHERRRFTLTPADVGGYVHGYLSSLQTAIVAEIFERFCQAEFMADWAWVTERHGDDAATAAMPRTAAQRRADAFVAMALRAASAPPGSTPPEPFVFVIDYETINDTARRRCATNESDAMQFDDQPESHTVDDLADIDDEADAGDEVDDVPIAPPPTRAGRPLRHDPGRRRCDSGDIAVDPADVFTAAVLGRIRAVVVDRAGVAVKVGRRSRLFRGPLRDALLATGGRCSCRGCTTRRRLEIDHVIAWNDLGNTDSDNGDPRCRWHNNLKNKGFTTWRDPDGIWHHYRPDGTEITCV